MSGALRYLPGFEGEGRSRDLSQWYTPSDLAERLWSWAKPSSTSRVLEPSAGRGALVLPMLRDRYVRRVTAVDIDARNVEALKDLPMSNRGARLSVVRGDFLSFTPRARFDLCVMNPPFEQDRDVDFVLHALGFAPVVYGIFRSAIVHGGGRFEKFWRHVRMTRVAYLVNRPRFGEGTGAQSDFIAARFVKREEPFGRGEPSACKQEWW